MEDPVNMYLQEVTELSYNTLTPLSSLKGSSSKRLLTQQQLTGTQWLQQLSNYCFYLHVSPKLNAGTESQGWDGAF